MKLSENWRCLSDDKSDRLLYSIGKNDITIAITKRLMPDENHFYKVKMQVQSHLNIIAESEFIYNSNTDDELEEIAARELLKCLNKRIKAISYDLSILHNVLNNILEQD